MGSCKGNIDIVENMAYIIQVSRKMKEEFPSIPLEDIQAELILLVLKYQKIYDPDKGAITTFIANYPARRLRQELIYKYVHFKYIDKKRIFVETLSINSKISDNPNSSDYLDSLELVEADKNNEYSSSLDESSLMCYEILKEIDESCLSKREKEILIMYFGLIDGDRMTLEEIGKKINLTRERVRVIKKKAERKLKSKIFFQQIC